MRICLFDGVKSIVGKRENHGYKHLFLFPQFFLSFPWARHFRAQPSTGETQKNMNNVSCRRDMTEILLKAA